MRLSTILLSLLFLSTLVNAQEAAPIIESSTNKGKIYVFWGWNRGWYSNSDIHFTGNNYDFTLNDVKAQDRQSDFGLDPYFNPSRITIPQTNLRIGYFINNTLDISVGVDHMKYIMPNDQTAKITGKINDDSNYDGTYANDDIALTKDFLFFEHSDGLNYLNAEITKNHDLLNTFKITHNKDIIQIDALVGFGFGALMPKSNVTLWNNERNDDFHFAGYGLDVKAGLNLTIFKFILLRGEYKVGFIDMPDVRTSPDPSDKASHHFTFSQLNFMFGFAINPFN